MKPDHEQKPTQPKTAADLSVRESFYTAVEKERQALPSSAQEYRALVSRHFVDRVRLSWDTAATRLVRA